MTTITVNNTNLTPKEQEELLNLGHNFFKCQGRKILFLDRPGIWKGYATFTKPQEAEEGLELLIKDPRSHVCDC